VERRLAAILAADVVGYSRLMGIDEEGTLRSLKRLQDEIISPKVAEHQGRIFKLMGDGVLAEFPSVVGAVRCAVDVQTAIAERNAGTSEDRRIFYRVGINLGDIVVEGNDIFGDGVNVAARLEGLAEPGGICVHRTVRNEVRDRLPVAFEDMGEVAVKNIVRPVRAFRIRLDRGASPPVASRALARRRPGILVAAAAALVVTAAGAAGFWLRPWEGAHRDTASGATCAAIPDKPSVAVLPFANLSEEQGQAYFANGLGDDLITQLSQVSGLFVIDRNSISGYRDKTVRPQTVACDLGVRYVLEGSIQRSGQHLRINAQLIDAGDGHHLWSERYDRETADVFALQDDVIGRIVSALKVELTSAEQQQIARIPTRNLEAYDYYLRAESENLYKADNLSIGRALGFYRKAVELDPDFAEAYAGYARAAVEIWRLDYDQSLSAAEARKGAYDAAGRALALDSRNARAYAALAILQLGDRRHAEAVESARKAVDLNPNDAEAAANLAIVLAYSGQLAEAVTTIEGAQRLNPSPPPAFKLLAGRVFYMARQYDRAIAALEAVREAWPSVETVHEFLAASYARFGKLELARQAVAKLAKIFPGNSIAYYALLYDYYLREQDLAFHLDSLKLAGVTDWPYGLEGRPENRMTGPALKALVIGRTWTGRIYRGNAGDGTPFFQQFDSEGRVAYRTGDSFSTGNMRFDGDAVCLRFDGHNRDRWVCGSIYRNAAKAGGGSDDYLYLSATLPSFFTPNP
jgi:adenylate cyclase